MRREHAQLQVKGATKPRPDSILVAIPDASVDHRRGPSGFRPQHPVEICGNRRMLKPSASGIDQFAAENVDRLQLTQPPQSEDRMLECPFGRPRPWKLG